MSDFLIHAARLQDAGVRSLWVSLGSDKEGVRLMHVSPEAGTTPPELAARFPTRTFELCGTDRVLERLKDDLLYADGGPTPETVKAAADAHPLQAADLLEWFADFMLVSMPTDDEIEAAELEGSDEMVQRSADRMKAMLRGADIVRNRQAMKASPEGKVSEK